ncbi:hypothetical protein Dimus_014050 [Dionaea muscipula]
MEANGCDINHPDSDVLLPPRKRLLAGLKKQNSESTSRSPQGISNSSSLCGFDARINDLVKSCKNGSSMTLEEIAEAAGSAAAAAAKAASAARAVAEEKSAIAAKAVAAAKSALDLVASFSEDSGMKERNYKKNKLKKHVPVQLLYKKNQPENFREDEELARKLHRAMNSSPRISKHSPGSDVKKHRNKRLKISPINNEQDKIPNGVAMKEGKLSSAHGRDDVAEEADSEGSYDESYIEKSDDKASKSSTSDLIEDNSGEAESSHAKEKHVEASDDTCTNGRKRGRIKQKKLPLSFCSFKDQANPSSSMPASVTPDKSTGNAALPLPLPSVEPKADGILSIEAAPTWKCQDFKVPHCIKQNKAVHS